MSIDRIEALEEALRTELTHGGMNDEIAQVTTCLGTLTRNLSEYDQGPAIELLKRLEKAREDSRDRLEAVLEES